MNAAWVYLAGLGNRCLEFQSATPDSGSRIISSLQLYRYRFLTKLVFIDFKRLGVDVPDHSTVVSEEEKDDIGGDISASGTIYDI